MPATIYQAAKQQLR